MTLKEPFKPEQVDREIPQAIRDAMLNCVLAWGSLDGALSMLLARVTGMSFSEAADTIGKDSGTVKLNKMRDAMLERGANDVAAAIRKHKKAYEKRIAPRNRIAHARVAGVWTKDPDYIVFAVFESHLTDQLAIELVPIQEVRRSTHWATAMTAMALRIVDVAG
ncbi:hypothetical protein J2Y58_004177 [Sphingomonas sp. BE138]|uniref:hypothetical protein n=1 Tax=Sphingomonas sp. BE138 TaxID=2817845 RepID=UPI0028620BF7|nr:hypothetical protein [Sphingomonas sp. BE138]MDR6790794.1 hypothetical protein [Sphingomonas sp. BE138]